MNQYSLEVELSGVIYCEDPHCPMDWRGSGCYDKEFPSRCKASLIVLAESEEEAEEIANNHCYVGEQGCELCEVYDVNVTSIELYRPDVDGVIDIGYEEATRPGDYEPEPYED